MRLAICIYLSLFAGVLAAASPEVMTLSRYITVKTCYRGASCDGPVAQNMNHANIDMKLKPDAWDRATVRHLDVPFKSEIHVAKFKKPGPYSYLVSIKLRSGTRDGKVQKLRLKSLKDLDRIVISDEPVAFEGGTMQAQLVVGPKLPLELD